MRNLTLIPLAILITLPVHSEQELGGTEQFNKIAAKSYNSFWHCKKNRSSEACRPEKTYSQSKNVTSNVNASSSSTGFSDRVCFYFNNTNELDTKDNIQIENKSNSDLKANTNSFFGSNCISGESLGGTYKFKYSTTKRTRTGEFNITGNFETINIDLSTNYFKEGPFEIFIKEE